MTALVRLGAATSLLAAIVLVVIALGQFLYGTASAWPLTLVLASVAFGVAWMANRHGNAALAAEHERLRMAPVPLPVPEGELVLGVRWGKWLLATLCFGAGAGVGAFALRAALVGGHVPGIAGASLIVAILVPTTFLLLETGRRALALGGIARLDAHGFRHCLLPTIAWKHVRGIDLELRIVKDTIQVWALVLAVDRSLAGSLRLARWWRAFAPGAPSVEEDGRLNVPLAYVRGKPHDVAGRAMSVADRWGAPRIPGWRSYLPPDLAASMHATTVSSQEATRTVQRLIEQLRSADKSPEEAERIMAQARRSMDEADRVFEEQMKLLRKGVRS